jgi:hypothetical protein
MKRIQIITNGSNNFVIAVNKVEYCSTTKVNAHCLDAYARLCINEHYFEIKPRSQSVEQVFRQNISTMYAEMDEILLVLEEFVFGTKYNNRHKMTIEIQEKTEVVSLNTAIVRLHTITPQTPRSFINDTHIKCEDANLLTDWDVEVSYADGIDDEAIIGMAIISLRQELGVNDLQVDDSLITDRISGETKTTFIRYTIE